ncbi:(R)-mandelonitrile lyase [Longimicrobium sp.]|uniref:(R)-mandelonitrile lyase n=1 Tax=Longimicrobium sp. TaxID=2029185 RepID=UPI003B3AB76E
MIGTTNGRLLIAAATSLSLMAAAPAALPRPLDAPAGAAAVTGADRDPLTVRVARAGSRPSAPGPAENFTGRVRIDPAFDAGGPRRAAGAFVTFEPGARTAWHTHPLGQTLIVTAGVGRVRQWGGPIQEIRPGDVVTIPAGARHWHGAAPTTAMTHLAIQEAQDGNVVTWLEKVSDEQYGAAPR